MFFQANGVVLVLWGHGQLAGDMGIDTPGEGWGGIALAHNVGSPEEVHEIVEQARRAGAVVTRPPAKTFYGGYAGGFRDRTATPGRSPTTPASCWRQTAALQSARRMGHRRANRPGSWRPR